MIGGAGLAWSETFRLGGVTRAIQIKSAKTITIVANKIRKRPYMQPKVSQ
jgi:hypothetical protein